MIVDHANREFERTVLFPIVMVFFLIGFLSFLEPEGSIARESLFLVLLSGWLLFFSGRVLESVNDWSGRIKSFAWRWISLLVFTLLWLRQAGIVTGMLGWRF